MEKKRKGKKNRRGGREVVMERREGGREESSLASSLICKKCITSEIKRKITAPKQNTQSRGEKGDGWGREVRGIGVCVRGRRWERGKEESPVWISCRIGEKRVEGYRFEVVRGQFEW